MRESVFQKKIIWGIKWWQLLAFLLFYLFFAFQYWLALWYTSDGRDNIWIEALIDYFLLKFFLTIPLWWLYFIYWKKKKLVFKICMHLITAPVWIFCWFHLYRYVQDLRGGGYLRGSGIGWDVYIPGLVYFLQFAVFHVYDFYLQTEKQKEKEKELIQAAYNSEVNALKAQIQPHFLFNTLNSISATVPPEMEHTRILIARLADTFRYSLQASEKEFILLQDELAFIKNLLELEQQRIKKRLLFEINVHDELLAALIPPIFLQPIVENAVKHGINPQIEGGTIVIDIQKKNSKIQFSIANTGSVYQGDLPKNFFSKGIGLRNTALRLKKLFNEEIVVEKNFPSGLKFTFQIPVKYE